MKHYKVSKDTFMWKAGAVIKEQNQGGAHHGYVAIEDIWDTVPTIGGEYISARIVEHPDNAEFFERVYPDTLGGKIYRTKDQLAELYSGAFK